MDQQFHQVAIVIASAGISLMLFSLSFSPARHQQVLHSPMQITENLAELE